jgi:hypothetical protein
VLSVLAFNLMRSVQMATMAMRRPGSRKRATVCRFANIRTLR